MVDDDTVERADLDVGSGGAVQGNDADTVEQVGIGQRKGFVVVAIGGGGRVEQEQICVQLGRRHDAGGELCGADDSTFTVTAHALEYQRRCRSGRVGDHVTGGIRHGIRRASNRRHGLRNLLINLFAHWYPLSYVDLAPFSLMW